MKILIDIGHPAHVHYFRNFYQIMKQRGHEILITARDKEISQQLLEAYDIPYANRGKGSNSLLGKLMYLPKANYLLFRKSLEFRPDIFLSFSSPYAAQVSWLMNKPHIAFDDTEHALLGRLMYRPFTDIVLSPESYSGSISKKQELFDGFMELTYLHPNYFDPDSKILKTLGVEEDEKYVIVRFVSWQAAHDKGHKGISIENKIKAVKEFSKHAKVFISSESELPSELIDYKIHLSPEMIHHALYYATLFYGESATMASESALLGTPAIYLDNIGRGYTDKLEKDYGIVFNFTESYEDQLRSIKKGANILCDNDFKRTVREKSRKVVEKQIDVTDFLVKYVEKILH